MHPLKKLRKEKKLGQVELAKLLNVSQANISKAENGKMLPSAYFLARAMKFFGAKKSQELIDYYFNFVE